VYINQINAINFRNYKNLQLNFDPKNSINLIIAPNGSGKSNLLEIIYYLSYLRPFRNVSDKELINLGENNFFLEGKFIKENLSNLISVKLSKVKEVYFNKKKVKKYSEILGKISTVLFSNEDILIISGNPNIRRKYFDMFFSILDFNYLAMLTKYQSILKQKNFLIKTDKENNQLLDIYDFQLSECIIYITNFKNKFIEIINNMFQNKFLNIGMFEERVKILYLPNIKEVQNPIEILKYSRKRDKEFGFCTVGLHRDNYMFLINGRSFTKYASLGQMRLASLVLKIIQSELFFEKDNNPPILLIDDVILELDLERKKSFLNTITDKNQIFITITDREKIGLISNKKIINEVNIIDGR